MTPLTCTTVLRALKYILTILFSSRPSRPFTRTLAVSLGRACALTIAPLTNPYSNILPSTGDAIRQFCESKQLPLRSTPIPIPNNPSIPPATLHFITPAPAPSAQTNRILLFLHGGGYHSPLFGPSHLPFALRLAAAARAPTLAVLEYGLAPALPYPGQLVQAIEALRHAVRLPADGGAGHAPRDVVLAGDSAGGNLVAGVLAHLRSAGPHAPAVEGLAGGEGKRLGGAVMVSPWVGMRFEGGSYERNAGMDQIGVEGMAEARDKWRPERGEVWADMLGGGAVPALPGGAGGLDGFWKGVFQGPGRVVEKAVVTVGDEEIFLDDVVAFAGMAGAAEAGGSCVKDSGDGHVQDEDCVLLVKSPGEAHDGAVTDLSAGVKAERSMLSEILVWLEKL
ncbi:hypothetical protein SLS57_002641 [Botryosphaeria dothidea]